MISSLLAKILLGKIFTYQAKIAVVGLGYVGLPLAVSFGKQFKTVGFDISSSRIESLHQYIDSTGETSENDLREARFLSFTSSDSDMTNCNVFIVAVPTPVDEHNNPDLSLLISASRLIGRSMKPGALVIYESTVYPGCTEDDCVPVLEEVSRLVFNQDFFVGYSPERINPGDKQHTLSDVVKIVSGSTPEALEAVAALYGKVVRAGVCRASSIRVAEAAKVIENTQRDVNIALANEFSMIFRRLGIDTDEVLDAAATKWNFLNFRPGLVGGHCIGVDPYYLTNKAQEYGYHPEIILASRRLNEGMGVHVAHEVVKLMLRKGTPARASIVRVFGCTFKENCSDSRNSRVFDIVKELEAFGCHVEVVDDHADPQFVIDHYGVKLVSYKDSGGLPKDGGFGGRIKDGQPCGFSAAIVAVAHDEYRALNFGKADARNFVVYDVKGILPKWMTDGRL